MRIAGQDVLLPTMMVGNYPKPRWFTGQAWSEIPAGRYAADSISFEAFSDAILAIVHDHPRLRTMTSEMAVEEGLNPCRTCEPETTIRLPG